MASISPYGGWGRGGRGKAPITYLYWIVSDVVDARSFVIRILTMLNRNTKLIWRRESERGRGTMRWFVLRAATCPVTHCEPEFHAHARTAHTSPQPRPGAPKPLLLSRGTDRRPLPLSCLSPEGSRRGSHPGQQMRAQRPCLLSPQSSPGSAQDPPRLCCRGQAGAGSPLTTMGLLEKDRFLVGRGRGPLTEDSPPWGSRRAGWGAGNWVPQD